MTDNEYANFESDSDSDQGHDMVQVSKETCTWAMILHFSVFTGYLVPMAGLIVPILIWQLKKDELPGLDEHGKNVTNFLLSIFIYAIISLVLCLIGIGFALLLILSVVAVIFPIIGGIKASSGEVWRYPFMIKFF